MRQRVVIGLGSNLGSRYALLLAAGDLLDATPGISVVGRSSVRTTAPVGPPQPHYLNAAVLVETELDLAAVHRASQAVESALGRVREVRWGPRTIDLDLLWSSAGTWHSETLVVPHPALLERAFALDPLLELVPDATVDGRALLDVRQRLPEPEGTINNHARLSGRDRLERLAQETVVDFNVPARRVVAFTFDPEREGRWSKALPLRCKEAGLRLRRAVFTAQKGAVLEGYLLGDSA